MRRDKGFTLIELLVVMAIISLLASTVFASISSTRSKARDARRVQDARQLNNAIQLLYSGSGAYPTIPSIGWHDNGCDSTGGNNINDIPGLSAVYTMPTDPRPPSPPGVGNCVHYYPGTGVSANPGTPYTIYFTPENSATAALSPCPGNSALYCVRGGY